jgi:hypothetical protein
MNLSVRICRSCVERTQSDFLFDLGDRMCALLKRELAKDGLSAAVDVAERSCFRNCPPRAITTTVAPREQPWRTERRHVANFDDLDRLYERILADAG